MAVVPCPTGLVLEPGDPGHDAARLDDNLRFDDRCSRCIVVCRAGVNVANAVRFALAHHLPPRGRSGRHSYEAHSVVDGGVIDASTVRSVRIVRHEGTGYIGAGANLGTVYQPLWDRGRQAVAGGMCGGVGVAGLTLGAASAFLAAPTD